MSLTSQATFRNNNMVTTHLKNILSGQTWGRFDFFGSGIAKKGVFEGAILRYRHDILQLNHYINRWRWLHIVPIFSEDVEEGHRYLGIYLGHRGTSCGLGGLCFLQKKGPKLLNPRQTPPLLSILRDIEQAFQKAQKERLEAERKEAKRQRALARINKL